MLQNNAQIARESTENVKAYRALKQKRALDPGGGGGGGGVLT